MIKIHTQQSCLENAIELKISAARRIMGKIDVKNMDLYYSSFHALKNINLEIPVEEMTKSMASRQLDTIIAQYGK